MKKFQKTFRSALLCIIGLFLLFCLSEFISSVHFFGNGLLFKIGSIIATLALLVFLAYTFSMFNELSNRKREDKDNFVLRFPRNPSPGWTALDTVLADLVYDYNLSDHEIEHIAREGIHNAALQYRKSHPLSAPSSADLYETVFPYE